MTFSHNFKNITQNDHNQSCDTIALKRRFVAYDMLGVEGPAVPAPAVVVESPGSLGAKEARQSGLTQTLQVTASLHPFATEPAPHASSHP